MNVNIEANYSSLVEELENASRLIISSETRIGELMAANELLHARLRKNYSRHATEKLRVLVKISRSYDQYGIIILKYCQIRNEIMEKNQALEKLSEQSELYYELEEENNKLVSEIFLFQFSYHYNFRCLII